MLDVQVDNDGMLHVKLIGAGVEHTEEDVDGDDDPDALWYTFIYAAFTPDMIAKITGNRGKKFATWGLRAFHWRAAIRPRRAEGKNQLRNGA